VALTTVTDFDIWWSPMEAGGKIKGGNHWKVRDLDLDARSSTQQFYPGSPDSGMW